MTNYIMDIELFIKPTLKAINKIEQQRTLYNIDNNEKMVAYCEG